MKKYLTKDEVVFIHKNLIDEFGGLYGIRDNNSFESAVMRPQKRILQEHLRRSDCVNGKLGFKSFLCRW